MAKIKNYAFDFAKGLLNEIDSEHGSNKKSNDYSRFYKLFKSEEMLERSVVGIDIYKYSSYEFDKQSLIPFLFDLLYEETRKNCKEHEAWLFQFMNDQRFKDQFIPTGDGGFQILTSPLHAIIFIVYFEANLRAFNAGMFYPGFQAELGQIRLRYSVTYNKIIQYGSNFYGPGIINNARILSRDKLNRLLIDDNTHDWFMENINGIESLPLLNLEDISRAGRYKMYKGALIGTLISANESLLIHISSSKLSDIKIKEQLISVFNIYIQAKLIVDLKNDKIPTGKVVVAVGSPNASGIE